MIQSIIEKCRTHVEENYSIRVCTCTMFPGLFRENVNFVLNAAYGACFILGLYFVARTRNTAVVHLGYSGAAAWRIIVIIFI